MPTLAGFNGASLVPNVNPALNTLVQAFGTPQTRAAAEQSAAINAQNLSQGQQTQAIQAEKFQAQKDATALALKTDVNQKIARFETLGQPVPKSLLAQRDALGGAAPSAATTAALATVSQINPQAAASVADAQARGATDELQAMRTEAVQGVDTAKRIQGMETFQEKKKALAEEGVRLVQEGKDPQRIIELSNMNEGQLDLELTKMDVVGNAMVQAIPAPVKQKGPADFTEKDILAIRATGDDEFADQIVAAKTRQKNLDERKVELSEAEFVFEQAKERAEALTETNAEVQSSKILEDGTTIFALKDGTTVVADPQGNRLTGQAREEAILDAVEFGVDIQGERSGARSGQAQRAKDNQALGTDAFKQIAPLRKTMLTIDRGIELLEKEGANTGKIDALLPSFTAASIELETIMNQLGLDVVAGATFGALSAGELALALRTALPTDLEPEALVKWLKRKKAATNKLLTEVRNTAVHLRKGGDLETLVKRGEQQDIRSGLTPPAEAGSVEVGGQQLNVGNTVTQNGINYTVGVAPDGSATFTPVQ